MLFTGIHILGFYMVLIGTWRLATATTKLPMGEAMFQQREEEKAYNPLTDLVSPHKVLVWIFMTILSFNKPGNYTSAAILHKKFNWGLLWVLFGLIIQFVCGFVK
ncbi:MAG: hypothetical protein KAV87_21385 [Desulfobacteraceae bacterium]|nr:hypothetical protein [Desulfobacteraceae bacterium]